MKTTRLLITCMALWLTCQASWVKSEVQVNSLAPNSNSNPTPAMLYPYEQGGWKKLLDTWGNKPLVVHFWGVTCGPCLTEMSQWGQLVRGVNRGDGPVVFVQVDQVSKEITANLAKKMHIDKAPNYFVRSPFDEFFRFEIDPKWTGEIPYTVTIDRNGLQKSYAGPTEFKSLGAWLKKNK